MPAPSALTTEQSEYLVLVGNSPPSSGVPRAIVAKCYAVLASYRPIFSVLQTISKNGSVHTSQKSRLCSTWASVFASGTPDNPMKTRMGYRDEYLDEMLRMEGRGGQVYDSNCASCGEQAPTYRCANQHCHEAEMFCAACIVKNHAVLPTHWVEEWNGEYFERRALCDLGLVIQLSHPHGYACVTSTPAHKEFVLMDITGIHTVCVNFCECDARVSHRQQLMRVHWWPATVKNPKTCATFALIRLFQIMNCLGKVAAYDFVRSLELLTNNDGLTPPPVRTNPFCFCGARHIVRQYQMTLMMKRAGRGHSLSGVAGTAQGELALRCRACLQDGRNVPDGWDKINWDEMPEDLRYKYFLFLSPDCNFHLINRDVGSAGKDPIIGDGLRQCNMDFIVFSAILNAILFYLIISYDIACQYSKRIWDRMPALPEEFHIKIPTSCAWFKVPNFHLPPHKPPCHSPFSFHWMWGAGRTHGETVEQNWEFTNDAAASTKMMGLGTRHATLENLFGFHNWRRLVAWRGIFARRMKENVTEGQIHWDAFDVFSLALEEKLPDQVASWKAWVHDWESRQHTDSTESPFEVVETVTTMKEIRLKLAKEELLRSGEGVEVEREDTPSTFIVMGLEIKESQHHLAIDVKAITNPTPIQEIDFLKRRTAIGKRIRAFRKLQRTGHWDSDANRVTEAIRLFLPSDIADGSTWVKVCAVCLPAVEAILREGEAHEALETLTQGQGILHQNNVRIHKAKLRYRYVRNALSRLRGNGEWERVLQVLQDDDIWVLMDEERAQRET
ncbi:hypothetical protein B0H13DRAFT_1894635, partial [Mycena leptocephala]